MAYTYPQLQIGQGGISGTVNIGQGSLISKEEIQNEALVTNLNTGDVIDHILPSELIWARDTWQGRFWMYRVQHNVPVKKDDKILLTIDGVPKAIFYVRFYTFWGIYDFYDLFKERDI